MPSRDKAMEPEEEFDTMWKWITIKTD